VKPQNSVVLPGYREAIHHDIAEIAKGEAHFDEKAGLYEINGRRYGVERSGTIYPASGPGIMELDRVEYDALKQISRVDGELNKLEKMFSNNPKFRNRPDAIEKAINLYRTYRT